MVNLAEYIPVTDAASKIGCTPGRVRQLVTAKAIAKLPLAPRMYLVSRKDVERIAKEPAKTGRPRSRLAS